MDRKEFLTTCGFACMNAAALAALLQGCGTTRYYAQATVVNNRITLRKSEFTEVVNGKVSFRTYILVKTEGMGFPICIYRHAENDYTALFLQCTHRGCEVQPGDTYLSCPCHGSEFSSRGAVEQGPAEAPLKQFRVIADNDTLHVQL